MQKREKIIVALVIIAVIYGAVNFWLVRRKITTVPQATQAAVDIQQLSKRLAAVTSPNNRRQRILAGQINKPWGNIFASHALEQKAFAQQDQQKVLYDKWAARINKLRYSGYLAMGDSRIAIINRSDYMVGDKIDGFTLREITPVAVQLARHDFSFTIMSKPLPAIGEHNPAANPETAK
ncbi:MAG: general secretion pathway protein GspB [Deltaproteobacteria bacterium]|nr:general secretion pathway protein GspB [Deltaproteobacteria bacterium]